MEVDHNYGNNNTALACSVCGYANPNAPKAYTISIDSFSVAQGATRAISVTVLENGTAMATQPTVTFIPTNSGTGSVTVSGNLVTGVYTGSTVVEALFTINGETYTRNITVTVTNPLTISTDSSSNYLTTTTGQITVTPWLSNETIFDGTIRWTVSDSYSSFDYTRSGNKLIVWALKTGTCSISATLTLADGTTYYSNTITITSNISTDLSLSVSVSDKYYFSQVDDKSKRSVEDQLKAQIPAGYSLDYIRFSNITSTYGHLENVTRDFIVYANNIDDVLFIPEKKGEAVFDFTAYIYRTSTGITDVNTTLKGRLAVNVTDAATPTEAIVYIASPGDTVYMEVSDFNSFWRSVYPNGTLDYVTFTSTPSGGSLKNENDRNVSSNKYYYKPTRGALDLDEVHFEPNSTTNKNGSTITISFRASGTRSSSWSDSEIFYVDGKVNIVYMADSPSDINYSVGSNGSVDFKASDFNAAYKEATGSSAPSNMLIVFQGVPKSGTLTYTDSSRKNSSPVTLTSSNIKSRSFTNKSSGQNQLDDITYTSSSSARDSIEYIAYSGDTPKFKGTVTFNGSGSTAPSDIQVPLQSYNGGTVQFSWSAFTNANYSALSGTSKIRFSLPSSGTLTLNGSTAAGIELTTSQVSNVSYRPKAGFNGLDRVTFMAYDSSSRLVGSGTVLITVSGNTTATTPVTPTTTPTATPTVSPFTDVKTTDWFFANMMTLYSKDIVKGKGDGRFDPNGSVTYGEALKMVMESCGYTATVGTGSEWAADYKTKAVARNWVDSSISITAPISRNAVAELICKVLNITPTGKASPFADNANSYGIELYYTSPKIFVGSTNPNGGKPLFNNDTDLTRAQVCAIICRLDDYNQSHIGAGSDTMPDGT